MNKIISGLSLLCLILLAGCTPENLQVPEIPASEGGEVMVRFTANIPEFKTVQTRANGGVDDMHLLVFDENGIFIVRRKATLTDQTATGGTFTASLPASSSRRTVHFVSNLEESVFIDSPGSNEASVVALLNTSNATFWSGVELTNGISANSFDNITVELLRNQAKISVENIAANFEYSGFTIHNTPNKGTVAPYSVANGFMEGTITEPSDVTLNPAQLDNILTDEKYLFERKNANASEITTVIVQGEYEGTSYYYKIDLIDADKNRYDIERNWHYKVKIETVTRSGYTSFDDALTGASHNNTALDPVIEKYPMISDGNSKLEVEKTLIILTQPNQTFQVWAKYFLAIHDEAFDNTDVTVSLQTGNSAISGSLSFDKTSGIISGTGLSELPTEPGVALIRVSKGELARTIRVILRTPFSFDQVTINNASPGLIPNGQSQDAVLRFNIPSDFPTDLFPLPVRIYAQGLYPASTGLQMVVENEQIHYIYMASATGEQAVNFKTNKSDNEETVTLKADYFTDGAIAYETFIVFQGNITYGNNINVPNNATVTASPGSMTVTPAGKYKYTPPIDYEMDTPVTLEYAVQIESNTSGGGWFNPGTQQSFHEYYSVNTTVGNMYENGDLNLAIDNIIVTGRIRYTTSTNNYNNLQDVPNNATLSVTGTAGATGEMIAEQRYQLNIPGTAANNATIRVTYRTNNTNYYVDTTVGALRNNQYMQLRSNGGRVQN